MKDLREQVDQFLEDVFNGSVISMMLEKIETSEKGEASTLMTSWLRSSKSTSDRGDKLADIVEKYFDLVLQYSTDAGHTEKNAYSLYDIIQVLRFLGVFVNNPNNLKEVGFYKDLSKSQTSEISVLQAKLKDAYITVDNLQAQIQDMKKGRTGMATP